MVAIKPATGSNANGTFQLSFIVGSPPCSYQHTYPRYEPYVALARRHLLPRLAFPEYFSAGDTPKLLRRCVALGSLEDRAGCMLVPLSVTRPPPSLKEAHRLCVPASQRVCLCRGTGAPALVRKIVTIVLTWKRPAYRPHGHFLNVSRLGCMPGSYFWRRTS